MPTSTNVTNLKINELTEAQYDAAVLNGTIGANELSVLTDAQIDPLPSQTGNAGKFLMTNGTTVSWEDTTSSPATSPTLVAANWSSNQQTVNVTGVTTTNTVIVAPYPTDAQDYADAGILCIGQGSGTLTFSCVNVPAGDLQVNVVII